MSKKQPTRPDARTAALEALALVRSKQLETRGDRFRAARMLWEELRSKAQVTDEDRLALKQLVAALPAHERFAVFEKEGAK